jgi:hypothetical protein
MTLAIIVIGLVMTIWGVDRNAASPGEKKKILTALFGKWPPTKGSIFILGVFTADW